MKHPSIPVESGLGKMNADKNQHTAGEWLSPTEALTRSPPRSLPRISLGTATSQTVRYGFKVGDIGFILAARERAEVIDQLTPCTIPNTPAWFRGMINVRGNLVPVFDLLRLFDAGGQHASYKLMTIGQNLKMVALLIADLPEIVELIKPDNEAPPLPTALQAHIRKTYFYQDTIWVDMDFDAFFNALGGRLLR